jgi:hypothetical protein
MNTNVSKTANRQINSLLNAQGNGHMFEQHIKSVDDLLAKSSHDDVFVTNEVVQMQDLVGMPTRKGLEQGIISNGKLVNVVSKSYGHLPNETFFLEAERKLIDADIYYKSRSINRDDRSFAVDYVLADDRYKIEVKGDKDILFPMLRFTNSYDGSNKTSGSFGMYRKVCDNGLCIAQTEIGFSVKHTGAIAEIVLPKLDELVANFMDNEFFSLKKKFDILAESRVLNVEKYVQDVNKKLSLIKYEASDKNPAPSLNARFILDVVNRETKELGVKPNKWIVYNAFNELLHNKLQKTFDQQKTIDERLFDVILAS